MRDFTPTRAAGLARLAAFAPRAGPAYEAGRNADPGPDGEGAVSALSPWIRYRLVLEEETARAALALHGPDRAGKFLQEVFWRAYFKGWLERRPEIWTRYKSARDAGLRQLARDRGLQADYRAATTGATGIDGFDHWARELTETGWLHNHARMWFASIWIFTRHLI